MFIIKKYIIMASIGRKISSSIRKANINLFPNIHVQNVLKQAIEIRNRELVKNLHDSNLVNLYDSSEVFYDLCNRKNNKDIKFYMDSNQEIRKNLSEYIKFVEEKRKYNSDNINHIDNNLMLLEQELN